MKESTFKKILETLPNFSKEQLAELSNKITKQLGASEHFKWCVEWDIKKYVSEQLDKLGSLAVPYEETSFKENITLDGGIEMMWKLVAGLQDADVTPFSEKEAVIFVGSSTTAENATQTGVINSLGSASLSPTFPQVTGRSIVFEAIFGSDVANGNWREISVANGSGANSKALNRKVKDMGTKASGTSWTARVTISAITG